MKFVLGILFITLFAPAVAMGGASLTFDAARSLMRERNNSLKAEAANVESRRQSAESLKWLHGPKISAQAFEIWGETRIDIQRSMNAPIAGRTMNVPVDIEENYNFSGPRASISGTMPIFTGGAIPAIQKSAKAAAEEAEAAMRAKNLDLDVELVGKYFGLQLALSIENLRKYSLGQQNGELERAIGFERQGMISEVERMGVQVARDAAEREYLKARDAVRTARLQLMRLLLEDNPGKLVTPLFVLKKPLESMEKWTQRAVSNNPQIAVVEARVKQADQGVSASKSNWSPQVFAFGQYSFIRHYQTMIEPMWIGGLGINLTLWDSRDRLADYRSARATLRQARASHAEAINQVKTAAETAWLDTQNAREQYNLTASTIALARENLRLKSKGFGEGLYTALDVTEARDQLMKAEVERRVAAFQFVVNYAMLHAISGDMDKFMDAWNRKEVIVEK